MVTEEKTIPAPAIVMKSDIQRLLPPEPGLVLDGRFLIHELLSEGGTSRIFKATDLEKGDLVALKVPKEHYAQDAEFLERFRTEEEIGLRIRHPYLIAMRPVSYKSRPYLVMEYVKGETLACRLMSGPRPSVSEAARIAVMILGALEELHRLGIVHRDVTPQNVMLSENGTVRLMDYGIAVCSSRKADSVPAEEWIWGTPAYMAPEQVRNEAGDPKTDLYSLGIVLYEMVTGSVPFVGEDPVDVMNARLVEAPVRPRTLAPDLDPELEKIVLRALEKTPRNRYPSARAMKAALERVASASFVRSAGRRAEAGWKRWIWENWAEIAATILIAALVARICCELRHLST
ncbi:MAG TPA: serine/threonine-protein kinase [Planctomycetota bacterium]|nr:serine/threonine-protein kinase [Planctomycetota bacterium]